MTNPATITVHELHGYVDFPGEKLRRVVRDLEIPTRKNAAGRLVIRKADAPAILDEALRRGAKKRPKAPKP